jgi:hypothetical protein
MRATIIVDADEPEERAAAEAWFARWRGRLTYCSDVGGCGCCYESWDVDGPEEAIAELPYELSAMSDWTHPKSPGTELAPRQPRDTKLARSVVTSSRLLRRKWKHKPSP